MVSGIIALVSHPPGVACCMLLLHRVSLTDTSSLILAHAAALKTPKTAFPAPPMPETFHETPPPGAAASHDR